jgi:hypothetical protein
VQFDLQEDGALAAEDEGARCWAWDAGVKDDFDGALGVGLERDGTGVVADHEASVE